MQIKYLTKRKEIVAIIIHHSAVSYTRNADQWNATNNYHRTKFKRYEKKWKAYKSSLGFYNGYNFEIAMNGTTRQARKIGETTAAVYQQHMNDGRAVHIMLDGYFDIEKPTQQQEDALKKLLIELKKVCTSANIKYHRDFAVKTCPGKLITNDWAKNLISNNKTMFIKQTNDGKLYVPVGNKLIHFNTTWKIFAENFENATIIEVNKKEFAKFEVVKNASIKV